MESNKLSEQGSKIDLNQHYLRVIHTRFSLSGWLVFEKKIFLKVQTQHPPPPQQSYPTFPTKDYDLNKLESSYLRMFPHKLQIVLPVGFRKDF